MSGRRYFGTDGIRGRVGEGHDHPDFVLKLGWAAGRVFGQGNGGKVLIGKDTRISGYMFESALEAGLVAAGVNIRLLGPMTTPGVAYLTRTFRASAGIVITASHNPYQDNGIKFFSPDGDKLPDDVEEAIEAELERPLRTVDSAALGKVKRIDDANGRYIEFCKSTVPTSMNFRGLKIVVDCANGATYNTAPYVFEELGAEVIRLGSRAGRIQHQSGCRLDPSGRLVPSGRAGRGRSGHRLRRRRRPGADGRCQGPADRRRSTPLRHCEGPPCRRAMRGEVVGTLMSNLGFEHALQRLGVGFVRAKVGDRYIMEHLKRSDGILGGEPSGHIICRDRTSTGDGIVAALQVLAGLKRLDRRAARGLCEVEPYPQVLINVRLDARRDVVGLPAVQDALLTAEQTLAGRGRILLRASGTEPLVRVMVEGVDAGEVGRLADWLAEVVRDQIAPSSAEQAS
jgi:phosphoglucosamine mutase